jgi:hypothetical protein
MMEQLVALTHYDTTAYTIKTLRGSDLLEKQASGRCMLGSLEQEQVSTPFRTLDLVQPSDSRADAFLSVIHKHFKSFLKSKQTANNVTFVPLGQSTYHGQAPDLGPVNGERDFLLSQSSNSYYSKQIKHCKRPTTPYTELSACLVRGRPDFGQILLGG